MCSLISPQRLYQLKNRKHQNVKSLVDFGEITGFWLLFWEKNEVEEIRIQLKKAGM